MATSPALFSLAGKIAMVTGASSGFGRHFAQTLAAAGANVVVGARRVDRIRELSDDISRSFPQTKVLAVPMDVTDTDSVRAAFDAARHEMGAPCDVVVNNAGISNAALALDVSEADYDSLLNTNLRGCFFVAQEAARRLVAEERTGSIVNIASILGLRPQTGLTTYAVAKAGVTQMTKAMALEWVRHGVRVNALCPGYIRTEMNADYFDSEAGKKFVNRLPSRRLGNVEELDGPLLLLASDAGSFVSGSVMAVDGAHLCSSL